MSSPVIAIAPEASLFDAENLMERNKVKRLPVISDGRLVCIILRSDLLGARARVENSPIASPEDAQVPRATETELSKQD